MNAESRAQNAVDILCIGAQKAATSWAAHSLNLHPRVWFPEKYALGGKEVRFFDVHWREGRDWYRNIMTPPEWHCMTADVSPGYARISPPRIRACAEMAPTARVFYILRNPVERDWSSLLMEARRRDVNIANADFIDLMVLYDRWCIDQFTTYVGTIRRWRRFFGDQLWIGLYDDLVFDAVSFYRSLTDHLGLDLSEIPDWPKRIKEKVFVSPMLPPPPQMSSFLSRKYEPMVDRLESLLGRDLSSWRNAEYAA